MKGVYVAMLMLHSDVPCRGIVDEQHQLPSFYMHYAICVEAMILLCSEHSWVFYYRMWDVSNRQLWLNVSSVPLPTLHSFPSLLSQMSDLHHRQRLSTPSPTPSLLSFIGIAHNNFLTPLIPSQKLLQGLKGLIVPMTLRGKLK